MTAGDRAADREVLRPGAEGDDADALAGMRHETVDKLPDIRSVSCLPRAQRADGLQRHRLSALHLHHAHAHALVEPCTGILESETVNLDLTLASLGDLCGHDLQSGRALSSADQNDIADGCAETLHIGGVESRHPTASVFLSDLRDAQGQVLHAVVLGSGHLPYFLLSAFHRTREASGLAGHWAVARAGPISKKTVAMSPPSTLVRRPYGNARPAAARECDVSRTTRQRTFITHTRVLSLIGLYITNHSKNQ